MRPASGRGLSTDLAGAPDLPPTQRSSRDVKPPRVRWPGAARCLSWTATPPDALDELSLRPRHATVL